MTPQERELHRYVEDIDKRVVHLIGVLCEAHPNLDPVVVQRHAVIMALLERDWRLMDHVDTIVQVAAYVASVPELEAAACRNMDKLLIDAKLVDASYERNSRRDFFYGSVLLFGFTVRMGSKDAQVEMPAFESECLRLYVGGNSWMWKFAPGMLRSELGLDNPEDGHAL